MSGRLTAVFGAIMVALGLAILARAISAGAGPASYGVLLGVVFVIAGGGRLWLARGRS